MEMVMPETKIPPLPNPGSANIIPETGATPPSPIPTDVLDPFEFAAFMNATGGKIPGFDKRAP